MKRIFVGNLSWKATEDHLKPLFEPFGVVISVRIVTDQFTGKSRGFAFVEMETPEAAQKAVQELDNKPLLDRNLRVSLAQERTERRDSPRGGEGSRRGGGGGGGGGRGDYSRREERNYNS